MAGGYKALRDAVENIGGVNRAWYEWSSDGSLFGPELVVEIDGETDPDEAAFDSHTMDLVNKEVPHHPTNTPIRAVRIVPKGR